MGIFKNPKKILRRRRRFPRGRAAHGSLSSQRATEPGSPITPSQPPRTDSWRFSPCKASGSVRPATCLWCNHKKTTCLHRWFFCVGENLFFRAVSSQVSSAPTSLTSVPGMGSGGPSRLSTPTIQFAASLDSFNIIPQPFENCKPFFKIFRKNFAAKAAGLEKRLFTIVLNRASATRGFLKPTGSLAPLTHHTQPATADTRLAFYSG